MRRLFTFLAGLTFVVAVPAVGRAGTTQLWAVGTNGTIVNSADGGATWSAQSSGTTDPFHGVSFANAMDGWAVGGTSEGNIYHTTDGGANWSRISVGGPFSQFLGVKFVNAYDGWVVGFGGLGVGSGPNYEYFIEHTIDGGATWTVQNSGLSSSPRFGLLGVAATDPDHAWAVGNYASLTATADGGTTWTRQNSGVRFTSLEAVTFADQHNGWIVSYNGDILHTSDGGTTWSAQSSGTTQHLYSVAFTDPMDGWVVGVNGTILHTADGGNTWSAQNSGTTANLFSVAFADSLDGWATGNNGTILHTDDGGATWTAQNSGTDQALLGLSLYTVPEPSSLLMFSFGAFAAVCYARRHRTSRPGKRR